MPPTSDELLGVHAADPKAHRAAIDAYYEYYAADSYVLGAHELEALLAGELVAIPIHDEYVLVLTLATFAREDR